MNVCLIEGIGCDFDSSCLDTLVDSTTVFFVSRKDVLYNREDSQFDYGLCLIGKLVCRDRCKRFNCSCNKIFVSLGNKENYQYSVRGSRYGNLLYRARPVMVYS